VPEEKKKYTVVQNVTIDGESYQVNDTALLTDGQAAYRIGLSIEPHPDNKTFPNPIGEHREKNIDVVEETRPMKEPEAHDKDDRPNLRRTRTTPTPRPVTAPEVGPDSAAANVVAESVTAPGTE